MGGFLFIDFHQQVKLSIAPMRRIGRRRQREVFTSRLPRFIALLVAALLCVPLAGCGSNAYKKYSAEFFNTFDTVIQVMGYTKTEKEFDAWVQRAQDRFVELNRLYDQYNDYEGVNTVKTINDNAGKAPVLVHPDLFAMLKTSRDWCQNSPAGINIAMGSVLKIWHDYRDAGLNDPANAKLPPMDELRAAAGHTDLNKLILDEANQTVFLEDPEMALDVGSVAKGYATEIVARELEAAGWNSFIISSGGNVRVGGSPLDGKRSKWGVGITDPSKPDAGTSDEVTLDTVFCTNQSVTTAGDYQRFYIVDGKAYNHIIDPETLMSATRFRAVSVVTPDSGYADFLDTLLFILPYEDGLAYVKTLPGVEALWVFPDGTVQVTEGLKPMLKKIGGATNQ